MAARILIALLVAACTLQVLAEAPASDDVLDKLEQLGEEAVEGIKHFADALQKKVDGKCLTTLVQDMQPLVEEAVSKATKCVQDVKADIEKNGMENLQDDIRKAEMCEGSTIQGFAVKADPIFRAAVKCTLGA